jgi:ATPase subunit of ABC transporter with duplicated ATPase domains
MPLPVVLTSVAYATPDGTRLFSDLDLSFSAGRTGLVGRNGTGKSTLLKLIAGDLRPLAGSISRPERIGMLRQTVQTSDGMIADAMGVRAALDRLARVETGTADEIDYVEADWTLPSRIASCLARVGLEAEAERPMATLSGGQRTRVQLAALLVDEPDLMLLDEPTNNLDAEGREAVLDLLSQWRGGVIVVSHDRALLRDVDGIVELTSLGARSWNATLRQASAPQMSRTERWFGWMSAADWTRRRFTRAGQFPRSLPRLSN